MGQGLRRLLEGTYAVAINSTMTHDHHIGVRYVTFSRILQDFGGRRKDFESRHDEGGPHLTFIGAKSRKPTIKSPGPSPTVRNCTLTGHEQ